MQEGILKGSQELLCINTEKVYDWIINEASFDLSLVNISLPRDPSGNLYTCDQIDIDTVTCTVEPAAIDPIVIVDRVDQEFIIDGEPVTLQLVNIRKNFRVTIFVDLIPALGGITVEVGSQEFTQCEQVILCAPEGTDIDVSFTELDCFVCTADCVSTTLTDIMVNVRLCQSIQSTFDVTLEIAADFCQPRDLIPIPPCPAPTIPPQCPVIFPTNGDDVDDC